MISFPIGSLLVSIGFEQEPSVGVAVSAQFYKNPFSFELRVQGILPFSFSIVLSKRIV